MIAWHALSAGRDDLVEHHPTVDDTLAAMRLYAWEDFGNHFIDYLIDEETGEYQAFGIYLYFPGECTCHAARLSGLSAVA